VKTQELNKSLKQQTLCGGVVLGAQFQSSGMQEFVVYLLTQCQLHTELFTRSRVQLEGAIDYADDQETPKSLYSSNINYRVHKTHH
jgi:hypothetical protein